MVLQRQGTRSLVGWAALCLVASCNQVLGVDQDYSVGPTSATGGSDPGGSDPGGSGTGGSGVDCPEGEQDNDHDGTCEPACSPESCSGNGTCDDSTGAVVCTCDFRFGGEICASCAEAYAGPECAGCAAGYQDQDDNGTCEPECTETSCSGHGLCDDTGGVLTCFCHPDHSGPDCADACPTGTAGASCEFRIIYGLDIPAPVEDWNVPSDVPYDVDAAAGAASFDRVAYRLILDDEQVWVEMDPFTDSASELGMPMDFQHELPITGVTVTSYSPNQVSITEPTEGNVEMWSNCYTAGLNGVYDYDDDITTPDCYGCVQVHVETKPVLSFNKWSQGSGNHDIGIGESPTGNPDWTFRENAGDYSSRRLEIYIREP